MKICEWCGKEFDASEAENEFDIEVGMLSYQNIRKCLCGSCAVEAINDQVDGVYFEHCENCGKRFDYIMDSCEFERTTGMDLTDFWGTQILCCDCALDVAQ